MKDLRDAILAVLMDANSVNNSCTLFVDRDLMRTLQAEYNIHFVEPDDKQLEVV